MENSEIRIIFLGGGFGEIVKEKLETAGFTLVDLGNKEFIKKIKEKMKMQIATTKGCLMFGNFIVVQCIAKLYCRAKKSHSA